MIANTDTVLISISFDMTKKRSHPAIFLKLYENILITASEKIDLLLKYPFDNNGN